jgi:hypothetical protein
MPIRSSRYGSEAAGRDPGRIIANRRRTEHHDCQDGAGESFRQSGREAACAGQEAAARPDIRTHFSPEHARLPIGQSAGHHFIPEHQEAIRCCAIPIGVSNGNTSSAFLFSVCEKTRNSEWFSGMQKITGDKKVFRVSGNAAWKKSWGILEDTVLICGKHRG